MRKLTLLSLPLLVYPLSGYSAIDLTDSFSISGFGSTSVTKSDNSTELFVHREITDHTCYDCDTLFGLQADWDITETLNASIQVVKRPQDHWSSPELEWAYVGYDADALNFKAGRVRIPLFLLSEYYYVGQAYTFARPPQEVYDSLLGFNYYDGASITWQTDMGDEAVLSFNPFYGFGISNTTYYGNEQITIDSDYITGISAEISGFNYRIHAAYINTRYTMSSSTPDEDQELNIFSLGSEYSWNNWQFFAEVQTDEIQTNWNASAAYHWNDFTPYLVYGESHHRRKSSSVTAGIRYDLTYKISLNAEWQGIYMSQSDYDKFQTGQFVMPPKALGEDKDAQVFTLMLNFVF